MRSTLLGAIAIAVVLGTTPVASASARATGNKPAWQRVHHADIDGDGKPDRIWFTLGHDARFSAGLPTGHWTLHATVSSTDDTVSRTFAMYGYGSSSPQHWTPWVGATDLDHTGGQDLVLGAEGAADAAIFQVVVYWHGSLRSLPQPGARPGGAADPGSPPDDEVWPIVGAYLHGAGTRCSQHGVATRTYEAVNHRGTRWRLTRTRYVWRQDAWHQVEAKAWTVRTRTGHVPHAADRFARFSCPGLHLSL